MKHLSIASQFLNWSCLSHHCHDSTLRCSPSGGCYFLFSGCTPLLGQESYKGSHYHFTQPVSDLKASIVHDILSTCSQIQGSFSNKTRMPPLTSETVSWSSFRSTPHPPNLGDRGLKKEKKAYPSSNTPPHHNYIHSPKTNQTPSL